MGSAEIFSAMAVYALAGFKILPAIQNIFGFVVQIKSNIQSFDAIHNDLEKERELSAFLNRLNKNLTTNALPFEKNIQLKDVSYWFDDKKQRLLKMLTYKLTEERLLQL